MKEIILCKYGELALKGLNKRWFEATLIREIKYRLYHCGKIKIAAAQSALTITPEDDGFDFERAYGIIKRMFGFAAVGRAAVVEKDIDKISEAAVAYIPAYLDGKKTFKVETKRSDKRFPMTSPEISARIGGDILDSVYSNGGKIAVDVNNPEVTVRVEIRDQHAFVSAGQEKGAGGMPLGTNGRGLLLLSGGIDSPVAGHMIAKRGVIIEAVHFESFPYTSELARGKVLELARIMCAYCGKIRVHVVSVTKIQEELRAKTEEDYFTILLRRSMMRIANRIAKQNDCAALITGESLGQVASQTMSAIGVTDASAEIPVLRPCIGMDKEEIITVARFIGTFETSILPYEDCCTVFTPRHPKTKPRLAETMAEEAKSELLPSLEDEAAAGATLYEVRGDTIVDELEGIPESGFGAEKNNENEIKQGE